MLKDTPISVRRLWGTGLTTALALTAGLALGHVEWGIWAFLGGFASLYVHSQPYRVRAITLLLVGLGLVVSMGLGGLATVWWHMALALGFVAAASTYLTGAFDVPLPAGFIFVLVACISSALPLHPAGIIWIRMLAVLGGAGIAWMVGMVDWLWNPAGPQRTIVGDAFAALAHFGACLGSSQKMVTAQRQAAQAVMAAHQTARAAHLVELEHAANEASHIFRALIALATQVREPLAPEWNHLLQDLGERVKHPAGPLLSLPQAPRSSRPPWARWYDTMEQAVAVVSGQSQPKAELRVYQPTISERLNRGLSQHALVMPATARIGFAIALSVLIAHIIGIAHPFWIPLTAAAVLQGVSTAVIAERTVQRAVGTTLGLLLAAALLATRPPNLATSILLVVLQLGMLFFIAKNYGLSVVFITAIALLNIYTGTHAAIMPMVWARFKDTLIGSAIGLGAAFALWGRASSTRLPQACVNALTQTRDLMQATLAGAGTARVAHLRGSTLSALLSVQHLYQAALGELPPVNRDEVWPLVLSIERLGYLVMSLVRTARTPDRPLARSLEPVWDALQARLQGEEALAISHIPPMPQYPAIEQQLQELAQAEDLFEPHQALS
jgi:hypothetical protein